MTISGEDPREALAAAIANLADPGGLTVVEITAAGIATFDLHRDEVGAPTGKGRGVVPWSELEGPDSRADLTRPDGNGAGRLVVEAAGVLTDSDVVLISSHNGDPLARWALEWLRAARPEAPVVIRADTRIRIDSLLREIIEAEPLRRSYDLVLLERMPGSDRLQLTSHQLFAFGARRGDAVSVAVRCERGDVWGTLFTIVAWRERAPRLLSVHAAKLPPGRYEVTAELLRPGKVRLSGLSGLVADKRTWPDLLRLVPETLEGAPTGPAHLICAVEIAGAAETVAERLSRIRQMITAMSTELSGRLQVSLVTYAGHSFDRRTPEEPVRVPAWLLAPERALDALAKVEDTGPVTRTYPHAAQVEDMLYEVRTRVGGGSVGRTALLTIGDLPPHPPRALTPRVLPCAAKNRRDWEQELGWLTTAGVTLGAICDRPPEHAGPEWFRLADGAPSSLEAVDVRWLGARLGLVAAAEQPIPFPFLAEP